MPVLLFNYSAITILQEAYACLYCYPTSKLLQSINITSISPRITALYYTFEYACEHITWEREKKKDKTWKRERNRDGNWKRERNRKWKWKRERNWKRERRIVTLHYIASIVVTWQFRPVGKAVRLRDLNDMHSYSELLYVFTAPFNLSLFIVTKTFSFQGARENVLAFEWTR